MGPNGPDEAELQRRRDARVREPPDVRPNGTTMQHVHYACSITFPDDASKSPPFNFNRTSTSMSSTDNADVQRCGRSADPCLHRAPFACLRLSETRESVKEFSMNPAL